MGLFDRKQSSRSLEQLKPPKPELDVAHPDGQRYRIAGVWNVEERDGKRVHTTPNYDVAVSIEPPGHGKRYQKGDEVFLSAGAARVIQKHVILEPIAEEK